VQTTISNNQTAGLIAQTNAIAGVYRGQQQSSNLGGILSAVGGLASMLF
jgi:hypothetical protein